MILLILVGLYAVAKKRVRITHSLQLTGDHARNFGTALIAGALPATLALNFAIAAFVPASLRAATFFGPTVNVLFLAVALFVPAWVFRDRPTEAVTSPDLPQQ